MNYHNITTDDMLNGDGLRTVLWVSGCTHHCYNCQNPITWDVAGGLPFDEKAEEELFEDLRKPYISGITFSGGEPFLQADALADLAIKIKHSEFNKLDIICYTGYTYEQIKKGIDEGIMSYMRLLYNIDYLIDGKFEKDKASLDCKWRGSTNQRIIDVRASLREGKVVEVEL
jgi:anaerobic ribonucleoside-triphosphate reductase activating protein